MKGRETKVNRRKITGWRGREGNKEGRLNTGKRRKLFCGVFFNSD